MRFARRLGRELSWLALAPTLLLNLWHLRAERLPVQHVNDGAMHSQMVRFARASFDAGEWPIHAWYPYLQLGSPHFQHYPSLGHILTAALSYLVGEDNAYAWTVYLLLALWPVSIFVATRILGLGRFVAVAAAAAAPLVISAPGYGYEYGSYVWAGWGVWGQLWAMATLPLALALGWRAIMTGRGFAWAGALLGATMALHFLTGYLGMLALGIGALVVRGRFLSRALRAALVVAVAVAVASFELVPLIQGQEWTAPGDLDEASMFYIESHGARQVLQWFVRGELYDADRLPVLTVLVGVGILTSLIRWRHPRARLLLAFWALSMFLFFGPKTFGTALHVIPGASNLIYHRMIIGVHLAGIWLAGVGAVALVQLARRLGARLAFEWSGRAAQAVTALALATVALVAAWPSVTRVSDNSGSYVRYQQLHEEADGELLAPLLERVRAAGDGRLYVGLRNNWGKDYKVGSVPVYSMAAGADIDVVGFTYRTPSLMADVEAYFNEFSLLNYDLFNVRYLLLPEDRAPSVAADMIERSGRHTLWSVTGSGYVGIVDTVSPIAVDRTTFLSAVRPTLALPDLSALSSVEYAGREGAPVTRAIGVDTAAPGAVTSQAAVLEDGLFSARVAMRRRGAAVLKVAFDPGWRVTIDGEEAQTFIAAPALVGVIVPEGEHVLVFTFRSAPPTWLFLLLGGLALFGARRASRWGARPSGPGDQHAVEGGPEGLGGDSDPGRGEGAEARDEDEVGDQVDHAEDGLRPENPANPPDGDERAGRPGGDEVRHDGEGEDRHEPRRLVEPVAEEHADGHRPEEGETERTDDAGRERDAEEAARTGGAEIAGVLPGESRPQDVAVQDDRDSRHGGQG
jgi:hypothetical protein